MIPKTQGAERFSCRGACGQDTGAEHDGGAGRGGVGVSAEAVGPAASSSFGK